MKKRFSMRGRTSKPEAAQEDFEEQPGPVDDDDVDDEDADLTDPPEDARFDGEDEEDDEAPAPEAPKATPPQPTPTAPRPATPKPTAPFTPAPPKPQGWQGITAADVRLLFMRFPNPEGGAKLWLFVSGMFLTPITLFGALLGYVRGYNRFMFPDDKLPYLSSGPPIVKFAMLCGVVLLWLTVLAAYALGEYLLKQLDIDFDWRVAAYLLGNLVVSLLGWYAFKRWQNGVGNALADKEKFGTARFAKLEDLTPYVGKQGFYLGGNYTFSGKGHILTCAGTRGGKGTNLIIPNLLGMGGFSGSWVVIDPKGENAAITARHQRERQEVVILNPWGLLPDRLGPGQSYNPLDILSDKTNINLVDDAQIVAEMIVPIDKGDKDKFFTDNARAIISGLLLHLATVQPDPGKRAPVKKRGEEQPETPEFTLKTIWEWVRLPSDRWITLMGDMQTNGDAHFGDVVKQAGYEIEKLMSAGDRTWGNIIAVALQCTDFIKSPALQKSLRSGFDPKRLADGKTTLYVIIPADKLQSHARWLRLVVTTTMRAVVRKPGKRVCFLLDEFSALGYLPEIEIALSTYAGFEITVWPILQTLIQLQAHYKDTWETFIGNSTIRQFFSVNDNFTAEYVSKAIGKTTHTLMLRKGGMIEGTETNQRDLVTPDELRRASGQNIFAFMGEQPVTYYPKLPYYDMLHIMQKADANPYL